MILNEMLVWYNFCLKGPHVYYLCDLCQAKQEAYKYHTHIIYIYIYRIIQAWQRHFSEHHRKKQLLKHVKNLLLALFSSHTSPDTKGYQRSNAFQCSSGGVDFLCFLRPLPCKDVAKIFPKETKPLFRNAC